MKAVRGAPSLSAGSPNPEWPTPSLQLALPPKRRGFLCGSVLAERYDACWQNRARREHGVGRIPTQSESRRGRPLARMSHPIEPAAAATRQVRYWRDQSIDASKLIALLSYLLR